MSWQQGLKHTFQWKISRSIPIWDPALACKINVLRNIVIKTKIKTSFLLDNIAGNISCEYSTGMTSPFHLYIITL